MLPSRQIPKVNLGLIGGSGTYSLRLTETTAEDQIEILGEQLVYDTPYGQSPPFQWFRLKNKPERMVLTCRMHGWRAGVTRAQASQQVFWVFREAGVKKVLAEGGVGAANHLLKPRDLVIPHDYIDFSLRRDVGLEGHYLLVMRQALCPSLRETLVRVAEVNPLKRVFDRGIYVVTDGRHFESPAEVNVIRQWQGDIIGQSLCPEVYLAREIGACYAGLYVVVNYAEGVVRDWEHQELRDIFYEDAPKIWQIILKALEEISLDQDCGCADLRKPTLLKDTYLI